MDLLNSSKYRLLASGITTIARVTPSHYRPILQYRRKHTISGIDLIYSSPRRLYAFKITNDHKRNNAVTAGHQTPIIRDGVNADPIE